MSELRLHHLALGAVDVAAVVAFYRDVLALPEIARHRYADGTLRSVWLDLGGAVLMVEHAAEPRPRVEGVAAGLFLLALTVSPGKRLQLELQLERLGHTIEGRTENSSYFRDPEGNRVAVSHYPLREA